tara:strand:- start:126 stop:506 length:381 start_codon:yes stop_codon:yes gene_type:complete
MLVSVSNGELLDKYSILLIKKEYLSDKKKLDHVDNEIKHIINNVDNIKNNYNITDLFNELIKVNKELWNIEDNIRLKEKKKEFDNEFIELARSVYFTNDKRAKIKNDINLLTESNIFEVKSYEKYT